MAGWIRHAAIALALACAAGVAGASPLEVTDVEHRFQLALDEGWQPGAGRAALRQWRNERTGQVAMLARIEGPTTDAWRGRESFFDNVERGFATSAEGLRDVQRIRRDVGRLGRVPYMDLWVRYRAGDGGERGALAARFLFFRRYTLALIIDTPGRWRPHRRHLRRTLGTFKPYFEAGD